MRIEAKVTTKNNMSALAQALPRIADYGARRAAQVVFDAAQVEVPVDTGALRDSHAVEQDGPAAYAVTADTPYALYAHWGTRYHAANPWLARALSRVEGQATTAIEDELTNGIQQYETVTL